MCREDFSYIRHCIAVTNRHLCEGDFLSQIEKVCRRHPAALILREKDLSEEEYEALAKQVIQITKQYQVQCILHSFPEAALQLQQLHLHLPLRQLLAMEPEQRKKFQTIGVSVHSVEEARLGQEAGASYLTAGHIYETTCKPGLKPRGLDFLKHVCDSVTIPVYAIGGLQFNERQWKEVLHHHAAGGCIMSGFMKMK